jgi:hypothetical protein
MLIAASLLQSLCQGPESAGLVYDRYHLQAGKKKPGTMTVPGKSSWN